MSNQTLNRHRLLGFLLSGVLWLPLASLAGQSTHGQSNEGQERTASEEGVIREGRNRIRPRAGYELVKDSNTTVVVRKKGSKIAVGKYQCSVCPGSVCATVTSGDGSVSCAPATDCSSSSCFIDPF
jgi:hypothetical protein